MKYHITVGVWAGLCVGCLTFGPLLLLGAPSLRETAIGMVLIWAGLMLLSLRRDTAKEDFVGVFFWDRCPYCNKKKNE